MNVFEIRQHSSSNNWKSGNEQQLSQRVEAFLSNGSDESVEDILDDIQLSYNNDLINWDVYMALIECLEPYI